MLCWLMVCTLQTNGQGLFQKGDWTIRFHPLGLIDADAGINAGAGYRFAPRWTVIGEAGYLFLDPYQRLGYGENLRGWKWRQEIRYHTNRFLFGLRRTFHAVDLLYKQVQYRKETTVGVNCIQGNCAYYMLVNFKEVKKELGIALKGGFEVPLSRNGGPVSLELYAGLGVKFHQFKAKGIPPNTTPVFGTDNEQLPWESEGVPSPYLPGGIKIVYKLSVR